MKRNHLMAIFATLAMLLCLPVKAANCYWGYCNQTIKSELGSQTAAKCAIYIPAEVAQLYKGCQVTAVKVGLMAMADNVQVFITKDLNADPAVTKTAGKLYKGWSDDVKLSTPYDVDGEPFYIGYSYSGSNVSMGLTTAYSENGCWADLGDGWKNYAATEKATALAIQAKLTGDNLPNDVALFAANELIVKKDEPCKFDFSIKNLGVSIVRKFQVAYSVDGGDEVLTDFSTTMASNKDKDFTVDLPAFSQVGMHQLKLRLASVNGVDDAYAANNEALVSVRVKNLVPKQRLVVEEGTGTWCQYCTAGIYAFRDTKAKYPDDFIGIAVHKSDELTTESYSAMTFAAYPNCYIMRDLESVFKPSLGTFEAVIKKFQETAPVMDVEVAAQFTDGSKNQIHAEAFTTFLSAHQGMRYRLSFVLLEDAVDIAYQAGDATIKQLDDVARMNYSYNGIDGSIPADVEAEQTTTYETTLDVPSTVQHPDNLKLVALVIDGSTGKIENAAEVALVKKETSIRDAENVLVPDFGFEGDRLNVDGFSGDVHIYTAAGVEVPNSNLASGMYIVKATAGNRTVTKKIIKK